MGCDELRRLLATAWGEDEHLSESIVSHIRTCPHCHHGLTRLNEALLAGNDLRCEQCRAALPEYFEATRPEYTLVEMSAKEMAQVAFHLSQCDACREEYEVLLLLAELEERDEMIDL